VDRDPAASCRPHFLDITVARRCNGEIAGNHHIIGFLGKSRHHQENHPCQDESAFLSGWHPEGAEGLHPAAAFRLTNPSRTPLTKRPESLAPYFLAISIASSMMTACGVSVS